MKYFFNRFFIYIWVFLVLFVGYGFLLPEEHHLSIDLSLTEGPEVVWSALAAVENYPQWWSEVKAAKPIEALPNGRQVFSLQNQEGDWISYEISRQDKPNVFAFSMTDTNQVLLTDWTFEIEADAQGATHLHMVQDSKVQTAIYRTLLKLFVGYEGKLRAFGFQLKTHLNSQN